VTCILETVDSRICLKCMLDNIVTGFLRPSQESWDSPFKYSKTFQNQSHRTWRHVILCYEKTATQVDTSDTNY